MNNLIDGTITDFDEGDLVNGTVVKIEHDEVLVDIGFKSEGVIPVRELSIRKDANPAADMNILTEGFGLPDAIEMARDAIGANGITLQDLGREIPVPSDISDIDIKNGPFDNTGISHVSFVDIDFDEYRRKVDNKTVRRNVTLPNWLNQEAEKSHINVSRVLQEALMVKLGVSR